jgi:hypothetical protein
MLCSLATKIGDDQLDRVRSLESELGVTMLAFSCLPLEPAEIDDVGIGRIKQLEEELGVSLVAVQ